MCKRFQSLEGEFDLPAGAVEGQDRGRGNAVGQRGHPHHIARRQEGLVRDLVAAAGGATRHPVALFDRFLLGDLRDHEAQCRGEARDADPLLDRLLVGRQDRERMERLAVQGGQPQRAPTDPGDEVAAGRQRRLEVAHAGVTAV
jgi:hypothetical protein